MRLLPLCLLLLLAGCNDSSSSEGGHSNTQEAPKRYGWDGDLYGDVESVIITWYDVDNKLHGEELKPKYTQNINFNKLGHVTEIYHDWDADKIIDNTYIYNYDDRGYIKSMELYDKDNNVEQSYEYETDQRGNVTLEACYEKFISTYGTRYVYNVHDDPIEITHYDKNFSLTEKGILKYNEWNEMTSLVAYNAKGKMIFEITTQYNMQAKPTLSTSINYDEDDGEIKDITTYTYFYDNSNQLIKRVIENKIDREYKEEHYEYDHMGNMVKVKHYESEARILKSVTTHTIDYRDRPIGE